MRFDINKQTVLAREAYQRLLSVFHKFKGNAVYNTHAVFNEELAFDAGDIYVKGNDIFIQVGCKDTLKEQFEDNDVNAKIPIKKFTASLIAAMHERQHVQQKFDYLTKEDIKTLYIAIDDYATQGNSVYYRQRYLSDLAEIDAEKHGVLDAYQYLCRMLGSEKAAEELVLYYLDIVQNPKLNPDGYFFQRHCCSIKDVEQAFEDAFQKNLRNKDLFLYDKNEQYDSFAKNSFVDFRIDANNTEQKKRIVLTNLLFTPQKTSNTILPDNIIRKQEWFQNINQKSRIAYISPQNSETKNNKIIIKDGNVEIKSFELPQRDLQITQNDADFVAVRINSRNYIAGLNEQNPVFTQQTLELLPYYGAQNRERTVAIIEPIFGNETNSIVTIMHNSQKETENIQSTEDISIKEEDADFVILKQNGDKYIFTLGPNMDKFNYDTIRLTRAKLLENHRIPDKLARTRNMEIDERN